MMILKNNKGSALLVTILLLIVVTVIGLSLLKVTSNSNKIVVNERDDQTTFYFAEAGVNLEKAKITKVVQQLDSQIKTTFNNFTYNKQQQLLQTYGNVENYYYETLAQSFCDKYKEIYNEDCQSSYKLTKQFGKQPIADTKITPLKEKFIIESKGYFENSSTKARKVKQELKVNTKLQVKTSIVNEGSSGGNHNGNDENTTELKDFTVITKSDISISGGASINGNVCSINGVIELSGGANITGNIIASDLKKLNYPSYMDEVKNKYQPLPDYLRAGSSYLDQYLPQFPDDFYTKGESLSYPDDLLFQKDQWNSTWIIKNGNFTTNWMTDGYTFTLNEDMRLKSFNINGNNKLILNIGDKNIHLFVDELNISQGSIEIIGTGTLNIYAKKITEIGGSTTINVNRSPSTLNIYYNGSKPLSFSGGAKINGSLYVKNSDISLSGGFKFQGNIFTGGSKIEISGGVPSSGQWIVAPKAKLELSGGGNVTGVVIANSVKLSGGTSIRYGSPVVPNPAAPQPSQSKYIIETDASDPLQNELLIEIEKD